MRRALLWLLLCQGFAVLAARPEWSLARTNVSIRQIDLSSAIRPGPLYPQIDWPKLDLKKPNLISSNHLAFALVNERVEVLVLPRLGRIYSLIDRNTGHNQLWTNPMARPIPAHNDTGWWMVWGGIEFNLPRGEHGTTWSIPWSYSIAEDSVQRKAVEMRVTEPTTGLRQRITVSIYPGRAGCETRVSLDNPTSTNIPFAHWVNPMWAPGGRNELTARTELIVPCTAMRVPERDFTRWMLGDRLQPFDANPLRWVEHWRAPGDFVAEELTANFYGAFSHELDEGVVRIFDRQFTPGMDIWIWGFPPPPERQREYSLAPNLGYVEMWGGTARDFADSSRRILKSKETLQWTEQYVPFSGTRGLTYADTNVVLSCFWEPDKQTTTVRIVPLGLSTPAISLLQDGHALVAQESRTNGSALMRGYKTLPGSTQAPELTLNFPNGPRLRTLARVFTPVRWGKPYIDPP